MVQIIQGKNKPSFLQSLLGGAAEAIPEAVSKYGMAKEKHNAMDQQKKDIQRLGLDPAALSLPKEGQAAYFKEKFAPEKQSLGDKLRANQAVVRDIEDRRGLKPGSLSAYENDPSMAERVTKPQSRTQASQPIDPEQLFKIKEVRNSNEYENASPLKKYQLMTDAGISKENAQAESDIAAAQIKPTQFEDEASKLAAKSAAEYRDKVVREYEGAVSSNMRINKMMKLAESGKLSTPLMVKSLDYVGLPLSVLNNPNTEDYAKVENDYVRDVTSIFPGVIKNFEIESYMKTIPGLLNSDEGKKIVGENVKLINDGKILKYKAMEKLLKENKGVTPRNADIAVNDIIRDQLDEISQKYLDNVHNALEKNGPKIAMKDPQGNIHDIPTYELEKYMKGGFKIYNE